MSVTIDCTIGCERAPICTTCGLTKKPIGRSASAATRMCDEQCDGYRKAPHAGHLWPGELERSRHT